MRSIRSDIIASFRERGVRCTSQRYAILEYLLRHPTHPTADEIYRAINRTDPRASLATVYKALHALAEAGLIREVRVGCGAVRFEANTARHHHFVCERCGRMEDLDWFDIPRLPEKAAAGRRKLLGYELILHGLCAHCA
ncbi:MAG: Fur family transcriptional regulator [Bryobacterales bacterium]|nr:transcriptional repressor [Bryobacteraceae bacterium]MDW8353195.1 Fur family transcriptional regulator [Bryobacterales bacterium]